MKKGLISIMEISVVSMNILLSGCSSKDAQKKGSENTELSDDPNKKANAEVMKMVESFQRMLPTQMGDIEFQKIEFIPDKGVYVYMVAVSGPQAKLTEDDVDENSLEEVKKLFQGEVKRENMWVVVRNNSVNIHFKFQNRKNEDLYELVITPEDYQ